MKIVNHKNFILMTILFLILSGCSGKKDVSPLLPPGNIPEPAGLVMSVASGEKSDLPQQTSSQSETITPSLPQQRSLDDIYKRAKPSGPPGKLRLELIAFPYCGLSGIRNNPDADADVQLLEKFPYLVCAEPGHLSLEEKSIADVLKDKVKIFGYIYMGKPPGKDNLVSLEKLKGEIDAIAAAGWYGVFVDQFGYDFGETRPRQNEIVDYIHSKGLHCFVNAWFIDDALGREPDPVHNPLGEPSHLKAGDWYLMESFLMNNSGYVNWEDGWKKYAKGMRYKKELGINIAVLSYKPKELSWEEAVLDIRKSYMLALALGYDGWWYSDRLEDENFLFGPDPGLNWGDALVKPLQKSSPHSYTAETDRYILLFKTGDYPPVRYIVYDKNSAQSE